MPLILGANSLAGGYQVKNSLRFNSGSTDSLTRTPASASNQRTYTISTWLKLSSTSTSNQIFGAKDPSVSSNDGLWVLDDSTIMFYMGQATRRVSSQLLRDFSAWYHIMASIDTTQATASNRIKIYLNGSQITSFSTESNPTQNYDSAINGTNLHNIGKRINDDYLNGYLAEFYLIDGQALTPSSFGETDEDTGIWKPKAYTGSFGTNGFYLDFEDSANLGNDMSGNNNDFTVNNLTSIDQSTDTPTNNFATLNSLVPATSVSFSNGNLTFTGARAGNWSSAVSTIALNSGKWYAEFKMDSTGGLRMVAVEPAENISDYNDNHGGHTADGRGYEDSNGYLNTNGGSSAWGSTYGNGDIIGVALDMDNRYVYFSKNGVYQNSGVPTSGSSGTGSAGSQLANKAYYFVVSGHESSGNTVIQSNFGSPSFTIASGNADANGFGNFEYAVPSGYYALCTKNLAQFG